MTEMPTPDPQEGVYRLDRFDVEVRGRWREFGRSVALFLLLVLLQQPLRGDALAERGETPYVDPVVSLRISLILDVAVIVLYVMVAYRAWGLVRAFRAPPRLAVIARTVAYFVIPALVLVDVAENYHLWRTYTGDDAVGSLSRGPSQWVLLVGVPAALGLNTILALATDPRLYWKRRRGVLSARFIVPDGKRGALPRRLRRVAAWLRRKVVPDPHLARWKGVLQARLDDGGCTCGTKPVPPPGPPTRRSWGVICCSGGGVRSAAFSLGGLQALNERRIYEETDAVVGVSGGGYTSTAFHVVRWQSGDTAANSVDHEKVWSLDTRSAFDQQSPELQWLRRHTRYVLDSVRVAVQGGLTLAFGVAVNLVLLAVAIGTTAWFLGWLFLASGIVTLPAQTFASPRRWGSSIHLDVGGDWWALQHVEWVLLAGLALFVLERAWDRFSTVPHGWRTRLQDSSTALVGAGALLLLLLVGLPAAVVALFDYADSSGSDLAGLIYSLGIVPQEHCNQVLEAGGAAACGVSRTAEASTPAVGAASVVTIVTSILAVLASIRGASKDTSGGSGLRGFLKKVWAKIKDPIVPWLAVTVIVLVCVVQLVRWTAMLTTQPARLDEWHYVLYAGLALLALKVFSEPNRTSLHHFFRERIAYAFLVRRRYQQIRSLPYREPLRFSRSRPTNKGPRLVTCAVANASDPVLIPSQRGCTPFIFDDERIGLTDRMLPQEAARRDSATYEFAADHAYRDATIPAAVAMSAAAFSPLAGRENVRLGPYRAVLALANARLGVWMPNPLWVDAGKLALRQARLRDPDFAKTWSGLPCREAAEVWDGLGSRARQWVRHVCEGASAELRMRHTHLWRDTPAAYSTAPPGARLLEVARTVVKKPGMTRVVREAVGKASIYDRFLYVTDGGHYDNLGLIEALRRKPRRIFVIDASNDPEDTFRTLGVAVATARMDLDCELDLDPRPMRRLQEERAAAAWCTGTATFPDGATTAIYLVKAIMLDGMPWDVETYAASNLDFPRTSTGKQLYSELDFEAYRMLGRRAVEELLDSVDYLELEAEVCRQEAQDAGRAEGDGAPHRVEQEAIRRLVSGRWPGTWPSLGPQQGRARRYWRPLRPVRTVGPRTVVPPSAGSEPDGVPS